MMIDKMLETLQKLKDVHRKIYDCSLKKQECIVKNDVPAVGEIVKEEWALLNEATGLESKRSEIAAQIGREQGIADGKAITLQEILGIAGAEQKKQLEDISEELRALIEKQKKINAENQSLIDLQLEYMDFMVNTFLKEPQVSDIYGNSGAVEDPGIKARGIIDSEA